jgi:hypothetical protein
MLGPTKWYTGERIRARPGLGQREDAGLWGLTASREYQAQGGGWLLGGFGPGPGR